MLKQNVNVASVRISLKKKGNKDYLVTSLLNTHKTGAKIHTANKHLHHHHFDFFTFSPTAAL